MNDCIFSAFCPEKTCDKSCPNLSESSYLLERNKITFDSSVYNMGEAVSENIEKFLDKTEDQLLVAIRVDKTTIKAEQITYGCILRHWEGSQLHCVVYSLKFQRYLDLIQKSWGMKSEPTELQYMKIFIDSCRVLIISGLDFIMFKDFQCQTLLTLLQDREAENKQTILVLPKTDLLGEGPFFAILKDQLDKVVKK